MEREQANELLERIKKIERRLAKIERSSKVGLEDQLFFGIVISLIIFLLSLPLAEVTSFFQNVTKLSPELAMSTSQAVRSIGLLTLVLASATRYYGAISKPRISKRFRLLSLEFLLLSWNSFIFIFVMNISSNASLTLGIMQIPIACLVLAIAFGLMVLLEKKALDFYATRGLIFKKDIEASASKTFLIIVVCLDIAFAVEFVAVSIGMLSSTTRFIVVWIGCSLLLIIYSANTEFFKKILKLRKK